MPIRFVVVASLIGALIVIGACGKLPKKPTEPAAFITSNLVITPRLDHSDQTRVSVTVTNTGKQAGTYQVVMKVDDQINPVVITTKDVTLAGGASTTVSFNLYEVRAGLYKITIDNLYAEHIVDLGSGG